ncbi:MAG: LacI family transcriptional regulator [Ruminococcaceae bacterium]|nr:LacI family transcriptional regulator [Oscillospiraceae bacterium]
MKQASSTLKHIAQELGISVSTVSRALNGKSVISDETRKKVLKAAEKYAYSPNEVARSLQNSSTHTIAVVLPDISETFFGTIVKEIEAVVEQSGYMIILADTHENAQNEKKYLDMLFQRRIDALVLATVDISGDTVKQFISNGTPVVFIDNIPSPDGTDAITIDNRAAGRIATEYLIKSGHRRIATIIGSQQETTGIQRLEGYREALTDGGLEYDPSLVEYGDYKFESGYQAMAKLIEHRQESPFSAVYVTSEKMTYGALRAIRDKGLNVPEDISVVGFDIHNLTDDRRRMITTVRQPENEIGKQVGELLLKRIEGTSVHQNKVFLQPYIEKGDTVKKI